MRISKERYENLLNRITNLERGYRQLLGQVNETFEHPTFGAPSVTLRGEVELIKNHLGVETTIEKKPATIELKVQKIKANKPRGKKR